MILQDPISVEEYAKKYHPNLVKKEQQEQEQILEPNSGGSSLKKNVSKSGGKSAENQKKRVVNKSKPVKEDNPESNIPSPRPNKTNKTFRFGLIDKEKTPLKNKSASKMQAKEDLKL